MDTTDSADTLCDRMKHLQLSYSELQDARGATRASEMEGVRQTCKEVPVPKEDSEVSYGWIGWCPQPSL